MTPEVYVSTDVESDGPIPGLNSMLSFASAAFLASPRKMVSTFSANLDLLPGAEGDPETMAWWAGQQVAWKACRLDPQAPETAMRKYVAWLRSLPGKPVFVGYPAGYDFTFVYWYLRRFAGESPFSFSALDIKSYAMAVLGTPFRETTKRNMPKRWFSTRPHTHVALDDAIEQGELFLNILAQRSPINEEPRRQAPPDALAQARSEGRAAALDDAIAHAETHRKNAEDVEKAGWDISARFIAKQIVEGLRALKESAINQGRDEVAPSPEIPRERALSARSPTDTEPK